MSDVLLANPVRIEPVPMVAGLPPSAYVEYFGRLRDGTEFIIHRPRKEWDYNTFTCLLKTGAIPFFTPVYVQKVTRYRDGGTTDVWIEGGQFHFPTPFKPEEKPTFNGEEITVHERIGEGLSRQLL